ncbi:type I-C CRISPR-associated protein Cas8c/Csd1, partial [Limosilactobacillus mucosae]|nr:type I-C CRISPR-associated protein Cas8c/Csd1 [Limosilactobacillus mucosae]
ISVIEPKKGVFAQPLESLFQQLDNEELPDTNEQLAAKIKNAFLKGENICHLNANGNVYIMELDSPVPGRIDIVYYQSLAVQSYIDKLTGWYSKTAIYVSGKNGYINPNFSLRSLAVFRNGKHAKNDLIKNTVSS